MHIALLYSFKAVKNFTRVITFKVSTILGTISFFWNGFQKHKYIISNIIWIIALQGIV